MEDSIFNNKGMHKLRRLKKVAQTEVKIDFWEESVKIYVGLLQDKSKSKNSENKLLGNIVNGCIRKRIIYKQFKMSEDYSIVTIDNFEWYVPIIFNKRALKEKDTKTWEMLFYYIFKNEVNKAMKNVFSSRVSNLTLDEAPMTYKKSKEIIIEPTVEIIDYWRPLYNIKDEE